MQLNNALRAIRDGIDPDNGYKITDDAPDFVGDVISHIESNFGNYAHMNEQIQMIATEISDTDYMAEFYDTIEYGLEDETDLRTLLYWVAGKIDTREKYVNRVISNGDYAYLQSVLTAAFNLWQMEIAHAIVDFLNENVCRGWQEDKWNYNYTERGDDNDES